MHPSGNSFTKNGGPDKKRVSYIYDENVPQFSYGFTHSTKAQRIGLAHGLNL